ncbi:MotA/TolQ/ExbB proton channel family protein [Rhodopirellula sp. JC740]|uniref:MotA/TolQ/ExbB proton channel family protein n=1 Tax=Rhodopirellula halodulae TaxID=2894198 RepID=A0ABS8NS10_9BACT|nr:MotA/TolQ/ExbB proton channel family protein [Rhodopirellula sp. JC740]MCC9645251.1 MotA/TolQ/ExbB proton channel family protein [Rhodopirellula sp. JC740]
MLEQISSQSTVVIAVAALAHLLFFFVLAMWARGDRKKIVQTLQRFTDSLPHRSRMDYDAHPSDQIEACLADIQDVLVEPAGSPHRVALSQRMRILDERRDYLHSLRFETAWNVARTMIEAYPLAGVLGTILAIGAALASDDQASVSIIVTRFGDAIWSTFAGLASAITLMLINSFFEPGFAKLSENRLHVREMASKAKRELGPADRVDAQGNSPSATDSPNAVSSSSQVAPGTTT